MFLESLYNHNVLNRDSLILSCANSDISLNSCEGSGSPSSKSLSNLLTFLSCDSVKRVISWFFKVLYMSTAGGFRMMSLNSDKMFRSDISLHLR